MCRQVLEVDDFRRTRGGGSQEEVCGRYGGLSFSASPCGEGGDLGDEGSGEGAEDIGEPVVGVGTLAPWGLGLVEFVEGADEGEGEGDGGDEGDGGEFDSRMEAKGEAEESCAGGEVDEVGEFIEVGNFEEGIGIGRARAEPVEGHDPDGKESEPGSGLGEALEELAHNEKEWADQAFPEPGPPPISCSRRSLSHCFIMLW